MAEETIYLVLDRRDIDETGVPFTKVGDLIGAVQSLFSEAVKFRENGGDDVPPFNVTDRRVDVALRAPPSRGSLKIGFLLTLTGGALAVTANASQVLGYSVKDGIEAIQSLREPSEPHDDISRKYADGRGRHLAVQVLSAASDSGCTFVSLQHGNVEVILHGSERAQVSMIGHAWSPADRETSIYPPTEIKGEAQPSTVYYRGHAYPAFVIDVMGRIVTAATKTPGHEYASVLVWGSRRDLPSGGDYRITYERLDLREVTHSPELPAEFIDSPRIFFVTGAAPIEFE